MKNPATADKPDKVLLDILVCPLTRSVLEYDQDKQELVSRQSSLAYPVRGGIPVMVPSEARELGFEENRNRKKS